MNVANFIEQHIHIIGCIHRYVCVFIRLIGHINLVSARKQRMHLWDPVPPRASRWSAAHTSTTANSRAQPCSHHAVHTQHGICFCIGKHMSSMYDVLLRIHSCSGMHMSTRYNVLCDVPTQQRLYTGDCVQSVHLLHAGGTKQRSSKAEVHFYQKSEGRRGKEENTHMNSKIGFL